MPRRARTRAERKLVIEWVPDIRNRMDDRSVCLDIEKEAIRPRVRMASRKSTLVSGSSALWNTTSVTQTSMRKLCSPSQPLRPKVYLCLSNLQLPIMSGLDRYQDLHGCSGKTADQSGTSVQLLGRFEFGVLAERSGEFRTQVVSETLVATLQPSCA